MLQWMGNPLFVIAGALVLGSFPQQVAAQTPNEPIKSVCELKTTRREGPLSVMTGAYYDFEHGYFLSTPQCKDTIDGTGVLGIKLPLGKGIEDFPELAKLSSQTWLGVSVGKRVYFQGTGSVSISKVSREFILSTADRVWASSD